jgi:hypothetical protein
VAKLIYRIKSRAREEGKKRRKLAKEGEGGREGRERKIR